MTDILKEWSNSPLVRRMLFVAFNLVILFLIFDFFVAPIHATFAERNARISEQQMLLARLHAIAAQDTTIRSMAKQTDAEFEQGEFLVGANESVINADLQTRLKAMTNAAGARINSIQNLPVKMNEKIKHVGVRVDVNGSIQAIQRTVHAIENGKPYLFVSSGSLKMLQASGNRDALQEPLLQAQLDIYGALHPAGQSQ